MVKKRSVLTLLMATLLVCLLGTMAVAEDRQVLRMAGMMLETYNPTLLMGRPGNMQVASLIWDSLVTIRQDTTAGPEIAESWERIDNLTWIFYIREGMTWQDGNEVFAEGEARAVTAHDVVFALELHKKYSMPIQTTLSHCAEIVALDDYTVQITTDVPLPGMITGIQTLNMACIFPPEAATEHENGVEVLPIGSGPFELQEFVPGSKAVLTKNEDYWINVKLDEVQYLVIGDPSSRVIALEAGEADWIMSAPVDDAPRLMDLGYERTGRSGSWRGLGFNTTVPPYDDYRVREAISLALDIDTAWQVVIPEGMGVRAYGQQGPWNTFNYDPEGVMHFDRYSVPEATRLLTQAGWTDSNGDGWLDKDGEIFSANIKTYNGAHVQVLTILATQLQAIGIKAEVAVLETPTYAQALVSGDSDFFFDYSYSAETGLLSLFHSNKIGASNTHFVSDPVIDELLDLATSAEDPETAGLYYKAVQRLVVANRYIIGMWYEYPAQFKASYVKDFIAPRGFLELVNVENNVYIENN